ncbi:hypothetical protein PoB_005038800 [Plakobranchus ocellatus]|uniref:Uncharacterized protein n=1 Tax=Plakobranchus ocellatus TaxID=259542 RepID=A0AAV4BXD9_9GAST|nr:hypothetical protein PoB_005038800 [Plakobranchus ocellatus]
MSDLIPVSWMTFRVFDPGRSAENSQLSDPSTKLFLLASMLASLPYQDLVPPSHVNAFGWTGRPFALHVAIASSCNTLLCHQYTCPGLERLYMI